MSKNTPTVIVTPRVLLREGIASLLEGTRYKVTSIAAEPAKLPTNCCPTGQRGLAIVGIDREGANLDGTAESIRLLRSLIPDGKVVLVVESGGPIDLRRVAALSPDACIFDLASRDALIEVLELTFMDIQRVLFVFNKEALVTTAKAGVELRDYRLATSGKGPLSPREREILSYVAEGKSNKAIARLCNLSHTTVKVHLKSILRKTNTLNRTQAAIWAIARGVAAASRDDRLPPEPP